MELRKDICLFPNATVDCSDDSTPPGDYLSRISVLLSPGTYYLYVDGYDFNEYGPVGLQVKFVDNCRPSCDGSFCGTGDDKYFRLVDFVFQIIAVEHVENVKMASNAQSLVAASPILALLIAPTKRVVTTDVAETVQICANPIPMNPTVYMKTLSALMCPNATTMCPNAFLPAEMTNSAAQIALATTYSCHIVPSFSPL